MNAEKITNILVAHLTCSNLKTRIYKEKKIGTNICDVMAVGDRLVGYEIKSDVDDYSRLHEQVRAYNTHFDKNYIVVGDKHRRSVAQHIPPEWGIICVYEDRVETIREAKINKTVSRRNQLTLLWQIELKNLLIKNGMPLYALRDKNFIAEKLVSTVNPSILGKQIAEELLTRDDDLVEGYADDARTVIGFTQTALTDALSEEDLDELTLDKWISLYRNAKAISTKKRKIESNMANSRQHTVPYSDIEVSLGAPWISEDIINEFIYYLMDFEHSELPYYYKTELKNHKPIAFYERVTGNWSIENKPNYGNIIAGYQTWGTSKYNALYILEATLNLREIKLYDAGNDFDEASTIAVLEKQRLIGEEFKSWIWQSKDRQWEVEEAYNLMFDGLSAVQYDGKKLAFAGMNPNIKLFDYQKNAVAQIISTPNTLLAFDVGAGKTYIMIAAAMEMRKQGISRKNLFVVPNNIVGQWEEMFLRLYPKARVLTVDPKSFKPQLRNKILTQIRDGDYDGIIMAYSCFEFVRLSVSHLQQTFEEFLEKLRQERAFIQKKRLYLLEKHLNREIDSIRNSMSKLVKQVSVSAGDITFDQLEINTLFLDEAHNFKNVPLKTHLKNVRGVNTEGSVKCLNMLEKVRCVQKQNNGRGAVFATGTPLCNSIADAYVMQLYLQYDLLERNNLHTFDNWVKTFARPEQSFEIDVNVSSFRMVRRFAKFFNLTELSKMFSSISAFYSTEKSGLPEFTHYQDTIIEQSEEMKDFMYDLCARTEKIRNKDVHPSKDNMLKITTDGRSASLDLTLVDRHQAYDSSSKIVNCVNNVWEIYNKYDGCSQLIFCDNSTPKGSEFSVYAEIKRQLMNLGIPDNEIAFVHSYHSEITRLKLYDDVNQGKVRVLIGSTFKLGIGANVQTKLKAIHHIDVPWRPADMVQREGRIVRRGNENREVFIYRYIIEGSFDAYSWQILETKQRFISQFLSGKVQNRTISDLEDSVLSYAEVKALALSEPQMKNLAEKENELRNLRILHMKEVENKTQVKTRVDELKQLLAEASQKYELSAQNMVYVQKQLTLNKDSVENLFSDMKPLALYDPHTELGAIGEFVVRSPKGQSEKKPFVELVRLGVCYPLEIGESASGNARRVANFFNKFEQIVTEQQEKLARMQQEMAELEQQLTLPFVYDKKVAECEQQVDALLNRIRENLQDEE